MYAIVEIAGQQFKVEKDQQIFVHRLDLKEGEKLDGEGGFCARGRLITSEKSKNEMTNNIVANNHILNKPKSEIKETIIEKDNNSDVMSQYNNFMKHRDIPFETNNSEKIIGKQCKKLTYALQSVSIESTIVLNYF